MAYQIGEAFINVTAKTRNVERQLGGIDKRLGRMTRTVKSVGAAFAGAFATGMIARSLQRTINGVDELVRSARGIGFSANALDQWRFGLDAVGISAEALRIGIGDLQKRLGQRTFDKFYKQAGLDPEQLRSMDPEKALVAVLNRLYALKAAGMGQAELVGLAGQLFEEQAGKDFAKLLNQYPEFVDAMERHQKQVGGLIGGADDAKRIKEYRDNLKVLEAQFERIKLAVGTGLLQAFKVTFGEINAGDVAEAATQIKDLTVGIAELIKLLASPLRLLGTFGGWLGDTLGRVKVMKDMRQSMSPHAPSRAASSSTVIINNKIDARGGHAVGVSRAARAGTETGMRESTRQ